MGKRNPYKLSKKERLAEKRAAQKQARKDKEQKDVETTPDEWKAQLDAAEAELSKYQEQTNEWIERMTVGGDVRVQSSFSGNYKTHFAGHNSTALNNQWDKREAEEKRLMRQVEYLANKADPGRKARMEVNKYARAQENGAKMMFWGALAGDIKSMKEAQKMLGMPKPKVLTIERKAVGTLIRCANDNYDPEFIRCYHRDVDGTHMACDCTRDEKSGSYELSDKSKEMERAGKLYIDTSVLQLQRMALTGKEVGECHVNIFLDGPREFDIPAWMAFEESGLSGGCENHSRSQSRSTRRVSGNAKCGVCVGMAKK